MERYEGLSKITSHEDYKESKKRLEDYMKQYKWITETDSPYEDIKKALYRCVEKRKLYEEKDESESSSTVVENSVPRSEILENENEILSLKVQYEAIKSDTYAATLRRNITALYLAIGDYEARIESRNKKGKDEESNPFYTSRSMRRFRFFLANLTGLVPGEVNINVENNKSIPLYIIENYDLVNKPEITDEQKEKALMVVPDVDVSMSMYNRLFEFPVTQFIASYGIKEKVRDDMMFDSDNSDVHSSEIASDSIENKNVKGITNQHASQSINDNNNERGEAERNR